LKVDVRSNPEDLIEIGRSNDDDLDAGKIPRAPEARGLDHDVLSIFEAKAHR
jgi:hypothetical protein